jgi:vancomycin resistance protein YoaR
LNECVSHWSFSVVFCAGLFVLEKRGHSRRTAYFEAGQRNGDTSKSRTE